MARSCAECGEQIGKANIAKGLFICKTCYNANILSSYLRRLEKRRKKDERLNKRAFDQGREISAWLSLYRFGNKESRKQAAMIINSWNRYS